MAWKIELSPLAQKNLEQLETQVARRILRFLYKCVAPQDNPRSIGEALKGSSLNDFWKYRVGDYRLIFSIEDSSLQILVVCIGHVVKFIHNLQCLIPNSFYITL